MAIQLWQHTTTGDVFAVETDANGEVVAVSGALHYTKFEAALQMDGIDGNPEDVEWINEHIDEFRLKKASKIQRMVHAQRSFNHASATA